MNQKIVLWNENNFKIKMEKENWRQINGWSND